VLLDNRTIGLAISSKFARKQIFELKKIKRLIYVRNIDSSLNKERLIEYTVEINIYYQKHRERIKIDVIRGQR